MVQEVVVEDVVGKVRCGRAAKSGVEIVTVAVVIAVQQPRVR